MSSIDAWLSGPRVLAISGAASLLVFHWLRKRTSQHRSHGLPHPPGPRGLPIIGNVHQMPSSHLWEKAVEWGKEYGDLIYLENFGKPMLIVNSYEDAVELLSNRSSIYSSRPHTVMAVDLEGWDWLTTFVPYGDVLRKHRGFMHRFIGSTESALNFRDAQLSGTHTMLKAILEHPDDYGKYVNRLPGAVIMMNVYAHRIDEDDIYVGIGKAGVRYVGDSEHQFFLDFFPLLKYIPEWFPWVEFPRIAREARKVAHACRYDLYGITKDRIAQGTAAESMTSTFLAENTKADGTITDEDEFCAAASTLFLGGVDTSVTALMTFVMQMLKNPEVQKRAQAEIDQVVGLDQLPSFSDMEDLPYVGAVCAEVLRHASIITLNTPHTSTADDVYHGYYIPAGTSVLANVWAMAFDPRNFPDPLAFKPERWLSSAKDTGLQGLQPTGFWFGFGRRICPGQLWAENLLFIAIASLLASFNFELATGEDGNPVPPNDRYYPSFIRTLEPSKCKISPRSQKMASVIKNLVEEKAT